MRVRIDDVLEAFPSDKLHHHPGLPLIVVANVVDGDQVRMLEIQTLADATNLDIQVALDSLERDFFARIADREIDFTKSPGTNAALDRVTIQGARSRGEGESSRGSGLFHLVLYRFCADVNLFPVHVLARPVIPAEVLRVRDRSS